MASTESGDVVAVADSVFEVGALSASAVKLGTVRPGGQLSSLQRFADGAFVPLTGATVGTDLTSFALLSADTVQQIDKIQSGGGSDADKERAVRVLLAQLAVTGGLVALSVRGSAADIQTGSPLSISEEIDSQGRPVLKIGETDTQVSDTPQSDGIRSQSEGLASNGPEPDRSNTNSSVPSSGEQYLNLAEEAYQIYSPQLDDAIESLNSSFGDLGTIKGRAKRPESAANRLQRSADRYGASINSPQDAVNNIVDAIGTRIVIEDPSPETLNELVNRLSTAIESGDMEITKVNSLTGENGIPYLTPEHLQQLRASGVSSGRDIQVRLRDDYDSGYTIGAIYITYSNGVRGELQIIGREVLEIANAEHLVYDAFLNKPYLDAFAPEHQDMARSLIDPIRSAAQSLGESEQVLYNNYLNMNYINARTTESGQVASSVNLPEGFPEVLRIENLIETEEAVQAFKKNE